MRFSAPTGCQWRVAWVRPSDHRSFGEGEVSYPADGDTSEKDRVSTGIDVAPN